MLWQLPSDVKISTEDVLVCERISWLMMQAFVCSAVFKAKI